MVLHAVGLTLGGKSIGWEGLCREIFFSFFFIFPVKCRNANGVCASGGSFLIQLESGEESGRMRDSERVRRRE